MTSLLLPNNATPWEEAFADTLDTIASVAGGIAAIRGTKLTAPPPSFLPFLVYEYGLVELLPYVPNLYNLIAQGVDWQRIRGTHAALAMGLGFIGYSAAIEEAIARRKFWNSFQLRFPTLPPADAPDLDRVDGISSLSVPARSKLRRGVHYYDVTALETDTTRLDRTLLDSESGVQLRDGGPLWSFGRPYSVDYVLTEADGLTIGNWIDPVVGASLAWEGMTFPWTDATFPWTADGVETRQIAMANWFNSREVYVVVRSDSDVIGYRRARCSRAVVNNVSGVYEVGGVKYSPSAMGTRVYISALTAFGDGAGQLATKLSLLFNPVRAAGVPAGRLWLDPDDITGGDEIATSFVNIPLRTTVREEIKFLLRF